VYPISYSSHCLDIYTGIELFADILDMGIDRTIIEIVIISHDIFHEGFAFDHGFRIFDQIVEDRELCLRHLDLLT
jgi:hypothetical protein